ncbi:MAG: PKD domain-containing protein, partial [Chitinophagaceae bacterium]
PDGTITGYAWSKISGPAQYNISNANTVSAGVTNLAAGTYLFRLVVTDNDGATDDDTVMITVTAAPPPANVPPVANAGNDQWIQLPTSNVTLSAAASTDADGTITGYAWSKISGPSQYTIANANSVSTTVTNLAAGSYAFRLVVSDNSGATDDDTVMITVAAAPPPPNVPPVAHAGNDQSLQLPANVAMLDGTASSDNDGSITSYAWSKISGPAQYSITNAGNAGTTVNNLAEGIYEFRLVVTDNNGATDDDTVKITVSAAPPPPNQAPVAKAGNDVIIYLPSSGVTLDASASFDPDGTIAAYSWNRISGPSGLTIVNATTVYADVVGLKAGEYIFELTVTDNNGATAADQVKITVLPPQNLKPVAKAGKDTTIAFPASAAWLSGILSNDPDGAIVNYQWKQLSGPTTSLIQQASAPFTTVTSLKLGDYVFELTVTDNDGAVAKDTASIAVVNNFRYEEVLTIYPNPVKGNAQVRCVSDSTGELILRIIDGNGRFVKAIQTTKGQPSFEDTIMTADLPPGMYYLEAVIGQHKRMIKKFIKQ